MKTTLAVLAALAVSVVGVVVAQTPDPRVAQIDALIPQVQTIASSTPPLPEVARTHLAGAVTSLSAASAAVPPIPPQEPPPGTGACGESIVQWHPAVIDGCPTGHEHGDAPPQWATDFSQARFGHGVIYGGDEASSAAENSMKHAAFKGITATSTAGGNVYLRHHAGSNPMDRMARYHSYELYYRDTAGNVSFWQGWYDTGNPDSTTRRCLRRVPALPCENARPIILVADETSFAQGAAFEQWYAHPVSNAGRWAWDLGIAIGNSSTYYRLGENATAHDMSTWVPSGSLGLTRRVDGFWYTGRSGGGTTRVGDFCAVAATGQVVNCMEPGALAQYIAPTLTGDARVEFGISRIGFLIQKAFSCPGCTIPN
jgi:hypothetical protein